MKRSLLLIIGWLAASVALVYTDFRFSFHWNFINWLPKRDLKSLAWGFGILGSLVVIWFLARATRDLSADRRLG